MSAMLIQQQAVCFEALSRGGALYLYETFAASTTRSGFSGDNRTTAGRAGRRGSRTIANGPHASDFARV